MSVTVHQGDCLEAILAFVPFDEILQWCANGWIVIDDLPQHHGKYSVLMELR